MKAEPVRLQGLDGLRGLAALLVFAQHFLFILNKHGHAWADAIISTVDLGKFGVSLFFLISGFVIPFSLQKGLAAFWIGRAARLLPALWLSMLFCVALGYQVQSGAQLFANAFMVTMPMDQANISAPYWTLGWEMYFYGIVSLAFIFGWLKSPRTFGLLAIGFAFGIFYDARSTYLLFMFAGTLLRMVLIDNNEGAKRWLCAALGILAGIIFLWALFGSRPPEFFTALVLAPPVFLLLWNRAPHPALIWLGNVSYSLYLFHLPILDALDKLPTLAFTALGLALPLVAAGLVYRYVEKPAMALGKAVSRTPVAVRV